MQHKRYKRHGFCDSRYSNSHLVQGDAITSREVITVSAPFQLRQTDLELSLEVLISPHFTTFHHGQESDFSAHRAISARRSSQVCSSFWTPGRISGTSGNQDSSHRCLKPMGSHVQLTKISALIFLRLQCSASYVCLSNLMFDGYKLQAPGPQKVDTLAKSCLKNVGKTIINHPQASPLIRRWYGYHSQSWMVYDLPT